MAEENKNVKKTTTVRKTSNKKTTATKTTKKTTKKPTTKTTKKPQTKTTKKTSPKKIEKNNIKPETIKQEDIPYIIILLILAFVGIFIIGLANNETETTNSINASIESADKINKNLPQDVLNLESIKNLQEKYNNPEIVGLLYIPNTNLQEPITQAKDNEFYLNHNLYREYDIEGTVFLDYRVQINEGRKNLIYSHNSHTYDVPFRELENYYDKNYYKNHKYIYLKSETKISKYEIFSIYVETNDWSYTQISFDTKKEWLNHLKYLKEKSWYKTTANINTKDEILILQTCSNLEEYEDYDNKYLLIISKKVN